MLVQLLKKHKGAATGRDRVFEDQRAERREIVAGWIKGNAEAIRELELSKIIE